ncbi:phosphotransferase [Paenibacillus cremeus]|nr:phosphotransferase [Paenibacillus cremeus]
MELFRYVLPDGILDDSFILQKEVIYKGTNGKFIERFVIQTDHGPQSYIFKPLTNVETMGREPWAHTEILPLVPQIRSPQILARADHCNPDRYWAILEDFGTLSHDLSEADLVRAAGVVPYWHELSLHLVSESFTGNKPKVEIALQTVRYKWNNVESILQTYGINEAVIAKFHLALNHVPSSFFQEMVVSHGDFHRGNIAIKDGSLIVLDWEHVHQNSPYWDLYNLIDITHPVIRRNTTQMSRAAALQAYFSKRAEFGWKSSKAEFIAQYHLYSSIYSAWMLLLIEADLRKGVFQVNDLKEAEKETLNSMVECMLHI